jgi:hypothetical protein
MKSDCPHCGKPIRWWRYLWTRPAAGERKILPNRAVTVCPLCRGDIEQNTHPLEKHIHFFILIPPFLVMTLFIIVPGNTMVVVILGILFLVLSVAMGYFYVKTKNWQRFRRYEAEP